MASGAGAAGGPPPNSLRGSVHDVAQRTTASAMREGGAHRRSTAAMHPPGNPPPVRCGRFNVLRLGTCIGAEHEHPVALCRHERREAQRISRPWAQHQLKETVRTRHTRAESEQNGGRPASSRKR